MVSNDMLDKKNLLQDLKRFHFKFMTPTFYVLPAMYQHVALRRV